jgi:hypothetical protein
MINLFDRKYAVAVFILAIMIAGFWLRSYNHHDWLYFKMDQARDASLIANAVQNGPGELPLLGPRAGATEVSAGFLRLGPIFYYFQYLSGKIFGSVEPQVFAYPDLFFSILTIPLLYLFSRLYFSRLNSMLVTAMYAFSFIAIQYSRFAWNPNSLLFFTLLTFYGLLKFLRTDDFRYKLLFSALAAIGIGIGSQLHFLGLFCLPTVAFLVLFFHFSPWKIFRKNRAETYPAKKNLVCLAVFLSIILLIYSPVIISDVMRKGENAKSFIEAFSSKPNDKDFSVKFERSMDKQAKYYCLVAFSQCYKGKTEDNKFFGLAAAALMIAGLGLAVWNLRQAKDRNKKDFLRLIISWFGIFFILAIPLYSSLRPRFFITVFPLPFIFLGLIFIALKEELGERAKYLALIITASVVGLNINGTFAWFREQKQSQIKDVPIDRTLILKNQDGVTLAQLEKAADYMYQNKPDDELIFYVKPEHAAPIKYLLSLKNDPSLTYSRIEKNKIVGKPYFAVIPSEKGADYFNEEFVNVNILDSLNAGQISVYKIQSTENQPIAGNTKGDVELVPVKTERVYWNDIFNGSKNSSSKGEVEEFLNPEEDIDLE